MGWYAGQLIWLLLGAFLIGLLTGYLWWILGYQHRREAEGAEAAHLRAELDRAAEEHRLVEAEMASVRADAATLRADVSARDVRITRLVGIEQERDDLVVELASLRSQRDGARTELIDLRTQYDTTRSDLATLRTEHAGARTELIDLRTELATLRREPLGDGASAAAPGAPDGLEGPGRHEAPDWSDAPDDDLERIEGIGPRIAEVLRSQGIRTFARLAASTADELRAALERGGVRFAPSHTTWAAQARYLAGGDEDGFLGYTGLLVGGREPDAPAPSGGAR
jgi:predicted flap endonuclease-1-like 5' DNA nuclease